MKRWMIIQALLLLALAVAFYPAAGFAETGQGPVLAMMGGGGSMMGGGGYGNMGGYGGSMMGGGGYGNMGGYGANRFSPNGNYRGNDNSYHNSERGALRRELNREREELSEMIHKGNADPDRVDRKMDEIRRLERRLDGER